MGGAGQGRRGLVVGAGTAELPQGLSRGGPQGGEFGGFWDPGRGVWGGQGTLMGLGAVGWALALYGRVRRRGRREAVGGRR